MLVAFFFGILTLQAGNDQQDIKEVWFAGVHSDVGGSYPESESQLSKIALQWMVSEAEVAGLRVIAERKADIFGGKKPYVTPDATTKNQHESLHGPWWVAEVWPKVVSRETSPGVWKKSLRMNLARRRFIEPNPTVHISVEERLADKSLGYAPPNLPSAREVYRQRQEDPSLREKRSTDSVTDTVQS